MSVQSRTLIYGASAIMIAAVIIGASIVSNPSLFIQKQSGIGSLNIYLTDAPPAGQVLKYVLVNVSSIQLQYQGSAGTGNIYSYDVASSVGMNVNLTSLHGKSLLLGATSVPAGQISSIVINITAAKAVYTDMNSQQLKIAANGKLMVHIISSVYEGGTTDLTIDITPNLTHISHGDVLTPVIHVTSVEEGPSGGTTTHTAVVDESTTG